MNFGYLGLFWVPKMIENVKTIMIRSNSEIFDFRHFSKHSSLVFIFLIFNVSFLVYYFF